MKPEVLFTRVRLIRYSTNSRVNLTLPLAMSKIQLKYWVKINYPGWHVLNTIEA